METVRPLEAVDRVPKVKPTFEYNACDACGSRAYFYATVSDTILAYCGHHASKYEVKLLAAATHIKDLRYLIEP